MKEGLRVKRGKGENACGAWRKEKINADYLQFDVATIKNQGSLYQKQIESRWTNIQQDSLALGDYN